MTTPFDVHTNESAPEGARELLGAVEQQLGFVPNLMGILAESPAALEAYLTLARLFESSSLSAVERHVVLLTVSFENGCDYCMAAHSGLALMEGVPEDVVAALREGTPIADAKLQALGSFTGAVTRRRADLPTSEAEAFLAAGFTQRQLLDVILGVTQKTLSNYVNHLTETPLDGTFNTQKWTPPGSSSR